MILPKFWNDDYKTLDYITDYVTSGDTQQQWTAQGHLSAAVVIANYHSVRPMPAWVKEFDQYFPNFENFAITLHRIDVGRYFPKHADYYKKYKEVFNIPNGQDVHRMVMFFEDRKPGQFYEIDDVVYTDWKAGQVYQWKNDTTHMVANLGESPRYALIATCTEKVA